MGFDKLSKSILDKAKSEADKTVKAAQDEAKRIEEGTESELKEEKAEALKEAGQLAEQIERREKSAATLEARKRLMLSKKSILDSVFEDAKAELDKRLKKEDRAKLIEKLEDKAASELDIGRVYCNKQDRAAVRSASSEREMLGGLVAESKDGEVMTDYSFETLLETIKEKHMAEITAKLFS